MVKGLTLVVGRVLYYELEPERELEPESELEPE